MASGLAVFPLVYWESTWKFLIAAVTYGIVVSIAGGSSRHWDVGNIANVSPKNGQKTVIFQFFFDFLKTVHTIRTKISRVILHHIMVLLVQFH